MTPRNHGLGLSPLEKLVLVYVVCFVLLGAYLMIFNRVYFDSIYSIEDGVIEWLQFVALATAVAVFIGRFVRLRGEKPVLYLAVTLLSAALFVFAAGEEISWGQRLFNIQTTEWFLQNNAQGEMNLHNLVVGGKKVNRIMMNRVVPISLLLYLFVLTPLYHRNAAVKAWCDRLALPIAKGYQVVGYVAIAVVVEGIGQLFASDVTRRGELTEFGAYWIVLLHLSFPANAHAFEVRR